MPDLFAELLKQSNAVKQNPKQSEVRPNIASRMVDKGADNTSTANDTLEKQDEVKDFDAYKIVEDVQEESELARFIVMGEVLNNPRFKKRRWLR